jgi:hypothetical protein
MAYDREYLQELAESPIRTAERASKIWLPKGRAKSTASTAEERAAGRANAAARRALDRASASEKRAKLLAYYATTDIPAETVAKHIGVPVEEASKSLAALRAAQ